MRPTGRQALRRTSWKSEKGTATWARTPSFGRTGGSFAARGPYGEEDRREVTSSAEDWRAFWARLDSLGVWRWVQLYGPEASHMDGTRWSVAIAHEGRQMKSEGYDAFPTKYPELWQALRELEGKPPSPTPP